jgi:hypothetical protein
VFTITMILVLQGAISRHMNGVLARAVIGSVRTVKDVRT